MVELKDIIKLVKICNLTNGDHFSFIDYTSNCKEEYKDKPILYTIKRPKGHCYKYRANYTDFYNLLLQSAEEGLKTTFLKEEQ